MKPILLIDDDTYICQLLETYLCGKGYTVETAFNVNDAKKKIRQSQYDIIFCDFRLPDGDGQELLHFIKKFATHTPTVMMTAYAEIQQAVKLIKMGAFDYVTKPLQQEELLQIIRQVKRSKSLERSSSTLPPDFIIGKSKKIRDLINLTDVVAPTDLSLLIEGETGSGKEYLARLVHARSSRRGQPFIPVDCGAIPKELANSELFGHMKGSFTGATSDKTGVFEHADGGTLFLDEIGNLSYSVQVKLLRAVQERIITRLGGTQQQKVDVRIITATNEKLETAVERGDFREDLYHRLNAFQLRIPPLRERKSDIYVFVEHFMKIANAELDKNIKGISSEAEKALLNYPWYGNLRELKNVINRAVLLSETDMLTPSSFPAEIRDYEATTPEGPVTETKSAGLSEIQNPFNLREASKNVEKEIIISTLAQTNYNKSKAAEILKIDRKTLYNKMKYYNIS